MAHPGPPVAAAVKPPPPPEVVVAPRTYREHYADAANSPRAERTAGYLAGYLFAGEGAIPTPTQLRDQSVALRNRQPMAFLRLVNGQARVPEVSIVHRLLRFMDSPGDEPSGFHDRVLDLLGDILPHQYPTAEARLHISTGGNTRSSPHGRGNGSAHPHMGRPSRTTRPSVYRLRSRDRGGLPAQLTACAWQVHRIYCASPPDQGQAGVPRNYRRDKGRQTP
jgi:hypothetical protein